MFRWLERKAEENPRLRTPLSFLFLPDLGVLKFDLPLWMRVTAALICRLPIICKLSAWIGVRLVQPFFEWLLSKMFLPEKVEMPCVFMCREVKA
jgi:hypothetical protein